MGVMNAPSAAAVFPSLLDSENADSILQVDNLQAPLIPQPAYKEEDDDEEGEEKEEDASTKQLAIERLTGLSIAGGAVRRARALRPWQTKSEAQHGPLHHHGHLQSTVNANATKLPPDQRTKFRLIKTPRKPRFTKQDPTLPTFTPSNPNLLPCWPGRGQSYLQESQCLPYFDNNLTMADVDDRRDYRRGGGGGGGGGRHAGQKRRFREDDDYDRRPQRRFERPEYPSARARRLVWGIAENPIRNAEEDVVDIAKLLADNAEDEIFCDRVSNDIVQLAQEQPFKIPFVAAIVLYTNQRKPEFVQMIITRAVARIQAVLEAGEWRSFKLLLRFLGCLQPLFEGEGVFALLDELFNRAADLQSASSDDALGLELVKIIMLTIPYALVSTGSTFFPQASELLGKTDIIASAPRDVESLVDPYIRLEDITAPETPSVIGLLQKQLQSECENEWSLAFIPHLFKPEQVANGEESKSHQKYPFPAINVPQTISPGTKVLFPELYFSVYADQEIETVPPTTHLASSLLRDTLVDTIGVLDFNRNAAAKNLVDIDCYWARDTFVPRATPFDKIKDVPEGKSTWKPEDMAVDAIFSQMLQLPTPEHKMVYYHSMITETCKIAPGAIAPSLGRAIRFLYKNISAMDTELSQRFMDWFSHHLSNFDFRWKWQEWVDDVQLDSLHPQKAFILGALDKEVRLSFAKRIRQTLPEEYQPLIPSSKDNDIPEFKYNQELTPHSNDAKQLVRLLRKKAPDNEVESILNHIASASQHPEEASDPSINLPAADDDPAALLPAIDALATTICYIGSKSLSHVLSHIERQKERLMLLSNSSADAQKQVITSVVTYWREVQPGVAVNIIDKLLNYTILTPQSVIEWALDATRIRGGRLLATSWIYEMVEGTVRKVTGRVRQILAARLQRGLPAVQVDVLEKALRDEADGMRALFEIIEDALAPVAEGAADAILEGDAQMEGVERGEDEMALCRLWGAKWRAVFARKLRVEQMVLAEMGKTFPPAAEDDPLVLANGVEGGGEADGVNGDEAMTGDGINGDAEPEADVDLDVS